VEIHIFEVESILMLQHYISIALCICIEVCRDLMVRLVPVQHLRMQLHTLLGMRTEGSAWHSICIHIIEVELKFIVLILYVECKSLLSKPIFFKIACRNSPLVEMFHLTPCIFTLFRRLMLSLVGRESSSTSTLHLLEIHL
jgi:hypothetical protein